MFFWVFTVNENEKKSWRYNENDQGLLKMFRFFQDTLYTSGQDFEHGT